MWGHAPHTPQVAPDWLPEGGFWSVGENLFQVVRTRARFPGRVPPLLAVLLVVSGAVGGAAARAQPSPNGGNSPVPDGVGAPAAGSSLSARDQALIDGVHRTPPNDTQALIQALQPLVNAGYPAVEVDVVGMGRLPVAGFAHWSDDFLMPRVGPPFHLHQGNDVFATCGLPVRAPLDGVLRIGSDTLGGLAAYVTQSDGTYVYMAHLSAFVAGQATGQRVQAGEVVGFVGNTGDAQNGPCHVHFELHPRGGPATDPKPYLDQWLADAIATAPKLVTLYVGSERSQPEAPIATAASRDLGELPPAPTGP